jgi:hypothetical protein
LVEQPIRNRQVSGSSPLVGSILGGVRGYFRSAFQGLGCVRSDATTAAAKKRREWLALGGTAKQAAEKLVVAAESQPHGAKARPILKDFAARLKSCPTQNLFEAEFFRSL